MNEREQAKMIIDALPEFKLRYILTFLRGVQLDDEIEDDAYCRELYKRYLADPERGDLVPFEEALKECGLTADDL